MNSGQDEREGEKCPEYTDSACAQARDEVQQHGIEFDCCIEKEQGNSTDNQKSTCCGCFYIIFDDGESKGEKNNDEGEIECSH